MGLHTCSCSRRAGGYLEFGMGACDVCRTPVSGISRTATRTLSNKLGVLLATCAQRTRVFFPWMISVVFTLSSLFALRERYRTVQ